MRLVLLVLVFMLLVPFIGAETYLEGIGLGTPYPGINLEIPVGSLQLLEGNVNISLDGADYDTKIVIALYKLDYSFWLPAKQTIEEKEFSLLDILNEQDVDYDFDSDGNLVSDDFFLIDITPFDIRMPNMDYPEDYEEYENIYHWWIEVLFVDNEEQAFHGLAAPISVEPLPIVIVDPLYGVPDVPIEFNASLSYSPKGDIGFEKYEWDFGDDTSKTTTKSTVTHTYETKGNYTLKLKVTDEDDLIGTGTFTINIGTAFTLGDEIQQKKDELNFFKTTLPLDEFEKEMILKAIDAETISTIIDSLSDAYEQALTLPSDEMEDAIADLELTLSQIEIPRGIYDSSIFSSELFPDPSITEPRYVKSVSGERTATIPEMANAIALWQQENVDLNLEAEVKSALYITKTDELFSIVKINLNPSPRAPKYYLIMILPGNVLEFKGNYNVKEISSGVLGFTITNERELVFAIDSSDLVYVKGFASTDLGKLEVVGTVTCGNSVCDLNEDSKTCPEDCGRGPGLLGIILIIIFVVAGAIAIFFIWYHKPKEYPKNLFKNKRDYENILAFIRRNLPKKNQFEIKNMLLKSGWKPEQISYAMSKVLREKVREGARIKAKQEKKKPVFRFKRQIRKPISSIKYPK